MGARVEFMIANDVQIESVLRRMQRELAVMNYAQKTRKSYLNCFRRFCVFADNCPLPLNIELIKSFLIQKQNDGCAPQTVNLYLNSIKFFYRHVAKISTKINLRFAKRNKKIPVILSRKEIHKIITSIKNKKHKLIISLAYGAGLRVSEVANLRVGDLDFEQKTIHLKVTKASRERITILPSQICDDLSTFVEDSPASSFLFQSNRGGKLSTRTLQKIFKQALLKSNIKKNASFHSLRHCFATHLLEDGIDIYHIQKLLGHRNIQTTQIYARVTNTALKKIQSPLH